MGAGFEKMFVYLPLMSVVVDENVKCSFWFAWRLKKRITKLAKVKEFMSWEQVESLTAEKLTPDISSCENVTDDLQIREKCGAKQNDSVWLFFFSFKSALISFGTRKEQKCTKQISCRHIIIRLCLLCVILCLSASSSDHRWPRLNITLIALLIHKWNNFRASL